jgi:hypothetical protein
MDTMKNIVDGATGTELAEDALAEVRGGISKQERNHIAEVAITSRRAFPPRIKLPKPFEVSLPAGFLPDRPAGDVPFVASEPELPFVDIESESTVPA